MISIILSFYNEELYLQQCIESVLNQVFTDFELLLIDDGSTDGSNEIAKRYLDDARLTLFEPGHIGFPRAKNLGLDNIRGDYVVFIDGDDWMHKQFLHILMEIEKHSNADICSVGFMPYTQPDLVDCDSKYEHKKAIYDLYHSEYDRMQQMLSYPCSSFMWNKLFKRRLFEDLRFEDVWCMSDTIISPYLFDMAESVAVSRQTLFYHRLHNKSMTYKTSHESRFFYWKHRANVCIREVEFILSKCPSAFDLCKKQVRDSLGVSLNKYDLHEEKQRLEKLGLL